MLGVNQSLWRVELVIVDWKNPFGSFGSPLTVRLGRSRPCEGSGTVHRGQRREVEAHFSARFRLARLSSALVVAPISFCGPCGREVDRVRSLVLWTPPRAGA